jgi:hypothetical protein
VYIAQDYWELGHRNPKHAYYNIKHVDTLVEGEPTIIWPCRNAISY